MGRALAVTTLTVAVVAAAAPLGATGLAHAATGYPVVTAPADVSASSVAAGRVVIFSGNGFRVGTGVTIDLTYLSAGRGQSAPIAFRVIQLLRADSTGAFSTGVRLTQAGVAQLTATGAKPDGSTLRLTSDVTVAGSGTSGAGTSGSGTSGAGTSGSGSSGSGTSGSGTSGSGTSGSGASGVSTSVAGGSISGRRLASFLPRTGLDVATQLWLAGGLGMVGLAFLSVSVARRRTRA